MFKNLKINNNISELNKVALFIENISDDWEIPVKEMLKINLVLEEIISNIIYYAFDDKSTHEINIHASIMENNILKITIEDEGKEFNILEVPPPDNLNAEVEEREIGGLGIHFVKKFMDKIEYQRNENINKLSLFKNIKFD